MSHESLDVRAKRVFDAVFELPDGSRDAQLASLCGGDEMLRLRVEALLHSARVEDEFMRSPTLAARSNFPMSGNDDSPGQWIGPYRLIELIGEGGFGSVFLAEQSQPVRRRVALKIIKAGMDTREVLARFEAEYQALALMEHTNIARVLDAGATAAGRPYFVMELVRGEPITRFCDRVRSSVPQRLALLRDVCAAVQHAHQKGLIHRDLKPSNILVAQGEGPPLVKVIDFGIAKATTGPLTDHTLTGLHQMLGTPQYMSPEQADGSGRSVDTRTDIYAIGVLLYELLTGITPFERDRLAAGGLDGLRRILRDEQPRRPSHRLRTLGSGTSRSPAKIPERSDDSSIVEIAQRRRTEPGALVRALQGDLDWIVLKCLEKNPARRYETASSLSDDLQRYLSHEPVLATPPSAAYKFSKFVRRHTTAVVASAAVAIALIAATGVSVAFAISEARQRAAAVRSAAQVASIAEFQGRQLSEIDAAAMGIGLRAQVVEQAQLAAAREHLSAEQIAERRAALEQLLAGCDFTSVALDAIQEHYFERALAAIHVQFAEEPLVRARLLQTTARTLLHLGLLEAARQPQEDAIAIRLAALGPDHSDTLLSMMESGTLALKAGDVALAETRMSGTIEDLRRSLGADHEEYLKALVNFAELRIAQGQLAEAEAYLRDGLRMLAIKLGERHETTLAAMNNLGLLLLQQAKLTEAEPYLHTTLEERRKLLGADARDTLISLNNWAYLLREQGRYEEAQRCFSESLERHRRLLGSEHPNTIAAIGAMALMHRVQGRLSEAEALYREALAHSRRVLGNHHPDTQTFLNNLAFLLQSAGKYDEAEPYSREVMEVALRTLGEDHPETLITLANYSQGLLAGGKVAEALPICQTVYSKRQRALGPEHPQTLISTWQLGECLRAAGQPADAVSLLEPATPAFRRAFTGGNLVRVGRALLTLGRARLATGEVELAARDLAEAEQIFGNAPAPTFFDRQNLRAGLAELAERESGRVGG